jgi:hypothetical protein
MTLHYQLYGLESYFTHRRALTSTLVSIMFPVSIVFPVLILHPVSILYPLLLPFLKLAHLHRWVLNPQVPMRYVITPTIICYKILHYSQENVDQLLPDQEAGKSLPIDMSTINKAVLPQTSLKSTSLPNDQVSCGINIHYIMID